MPTPGPEAGGEDQGRLVEGEGRERRGERGGENKRGGKNKSDRNKISHTTQPPSLTSTVR